MEWIKTSDKLPDYTDNFIGRWWGGDISMCSYDLQGGFWWYLNRSTGMRQANIAPTHWCKIIGPVVE